MMSSYPYYGATTRSDDTTARPGTLPAGIGPGGEVGTYTVSAVTALARRLLEESLPPLWVEGEVSGWKRYPSGHCYFSLRDGSAQVRCVMFRGDAQRLPADPEDGMRVRIFGQLTVYERRGDFQIVVRRLEAEGTDGLWRIAFERLRARLAADGVLDPVRKRALPRCPAAVGVVTSAAGAALQDVLRVIGERAPWTRVVVAPARVQGDGAAADVARAIGLVGREGGIDVMIVCRGGGSVEDLWAFNEEVVARAIAAAPVPVISGVGHEVDVTIADLVADHRAATPSAAAERAVPDRRALDRHLDEHRARLRTAMRGRLMDPARRLDSAEEELVGGMRGVVRSRQDRLERIVGRLEALSPLATLRRGYAVPAGADGRVLRRAAEFVVGTPFRLRVVDGSVACEVRAPAEPLADGEASPNESARRAAATGVSRAEGGVSDE